MKITTIKGFLLTFLLIRINVLGNFPRVKFEVIDKNPGLFFEELEVLRLFKDVWKIVIYLDINNSPYDEVELSQVLNGLKVPCVSDDKCGVDKIRINYILAKINWISELKNQVAKLEEGNSGNLENTLRKQYNEWASNQHNQSYITCHAKDRTLVVRSDLNSPSNYDMETFRKPQRNLKDTLAEIGNLTYTRNFENDPVLFDQLLDTLEDKVLSLFNSYHDAMSIIMHLRDNLLYPAIINADTLNIIKTNIESVAVPYKFPLFSGIMQTEMLIPLSNTRYGFIGGRLLIEVQLPLVEERQFQLYRIRPFPVYQFLNLSQVISVFIYSSHPLLGISSNNESYRLTEEEYRSCKFIKNYSLCRQNRPIFKENMIGSCEYTLLKNPSRIDFTTCDLRYRINYSTFWLQIANMWIYSSMKPTILTIDCHPDKPFNTTVTKAGIMHLDVNCTAYTNNYSVTPSFSIMNDLGTIIVPKIDINISQFITKKSCMKHSLNDNRKIGIDRSFWEIIRPCDSSSNINQINSQLQEFTLIIILSVMTIVGLFIGTAGFIIYMMSMEPESEIYESTSSKTLIAASNRSSSTIVPHREIFQKVVYNPKGEIAVYDVPLTIQYK